MSLRAMVRPVAVSALHRDGRRSVSPAARRRAATDAAPPGPSVDVECGGMSDVGPSLQCADNQVSCSRLLRFSNPRQTYNGDPLGIAIAVDSTGVDGPADAVAVIDATAPVVANWRRDPATNRQPVPVGTLPPLTLGVDGPAVAVEVGAAFRDPDGDRRTYGAASSAPAVAAVAVLGRTVTVTPRGEGTTTVTVTATDAGGSNATATQTFVATVYPAGRARSPTTPSCPV